MSTINKPSSSQIFFPQRDGFENFLNKAQTLCE